ncbi:hypothetical protein KXD93_22375 [Mucilaginibacter sp. BJC16-A38]|uniref:spermine/spermidine synthase domain-containing protein n=1 Tax=Mucilaginibacter phenanthrenivorans TaxID=1234842 RepID=UPI00215817A5|nr:hypothetical protein [Mucilaginibacter phenanthrenivorans]MCR8560417.1 hypothetical protein [Mucilaginibacter phenanthrenivorans]
MDFHERGSNVSLHLNNLSLLEDVSSINYEHIQFFNHETLGKVLLLDGELQHIEAWAPLYHETVVHLPCAFIKEVSDVLILGGGDFFAAKEILKYSTVKKVTMVDFDQAVVDLMVRHYTHAKDVLCDPRFELKINDAFVELNNTTQKFDLIINDAVDLANHPGIDNKGIFQLLSKYLKKDGVCADLIYRHIFEKDTTNKTIALINENGLKSAFSLVTVPEYPGILHLLAIWGLNENINQSLGTAINLDQQEWIKNSKKTCEYFDPRFLSFYLYLPPYLKRITNGSSNF